MSHTLQALSISSLDLPMLETKIEGRLLDEGTGRSVFSIPGGFVLKVARNKKGMIENENENYIFQTISKKYKEPLCPVIKYQTKYLIMPEALPIIETDLNFDRVLACNMPFINYLQEEYDLNELDLIYPYNWGIYQGKCVLFDYGSTYIKRLADR